MLNIRSTSVVVGALLVVAALGWGLPAQAAETDSDTTFGTDGVVFTGFAAGNSAPNGVALQADGKIVAAGYVVVSPGANDVAVARYNPNGSLDTTFGDAGKITTHLLATSTATEVLAQADGKIVVVGGTSAGNNQFVPFVLRYNADGSVVTSFSGDGVDMNAPGRWGGWVRDVAVQSDGRIVTTGPAFQDDGRIDFDVTRYTADGSLDTTFDGDGVALLSVQAGANDPDALAIQPDGKIVVTGRSRTNATTNRFAVARFLPDGALDTAFGNGGVSLTAIVNDDFPRDLAVQPDGAIVVTGYSYGNPDPTGVHADISLMRLLPGGTLDESFSGDGKLTVAIDGNDYARTVALRPDGRILVSGDSMGSGTVVPDLLSFAADGSPDTTFDGDGLLSFSVGTAGAYTGAMALQPDGRVVMVHGANDGNGPRFAVTRHGSAPAGPACTVTGTAGDDRLSGTKYDDVICGLGGNDQLRGLAGNDRLIGGAGDDQLLGNAGDDVLTDTEGGSDVLMGHGGNDTLVATDGISGNDTLKAAGGTDSCTADVGDAKANCEA